MFAHCKIWSRSSFLDFDGYTYFELKDAFNYNHSLFNYDCNTTNKTCDGVRYYSHKKPRVKKSK